MNAAFSSLPDTSSSVRAGLGRAGGSFCRAHPAAVQTRQPLLPHCTQITAPCATPAPSARVQHIGKVHPDPTAAPCRKKLEQEIPQKLSPFSALFLSTERSQLNHLIARILYRAAHRALLPFEHFSLLIKEWGSFITAF